MRFLKTLNLLHRGGRFLISIATVRFFHLTSTMSSLQKNSAFHLLQNLSLAYLSPSLFNYSVYIRLFPSTLPTRNCTLAAITTFNGKCGSVKSRTACSVKRLHLVIVPFTDLLIIFVKNGSFVLFGVVDLNRKILVTFTPAMNFPLTRIILFRGE